MDPGDWPTARRPINARAESFVDNPDVACPACGDRLGDHVWYTTDPDRAEDLPSAGGVLVCPVEGCRCGLLWGTATVSGAFIPSADQIAAVAAHLQSIDQGTVAATLVIWDRSGDAARPQPEASP